MRIEERLIVLETQIKALQKVQWILTAAVLGHLGLQILPVVTAALG